MPEFLDALARPVGRRVHHVRERLAQVFGLMQQSGGSVDIDSVVGRGTTVALRLPACHEIPAPRKRLSGALIAQSKPLRLLLVDDDAAVRATIQVIQMGVPIARCELLDAHAIRAVNLRAGLGLRLPIESHVLQAMVSEPVKPVLDTVVTSGAVHFYVSQSDKGEMVTNRLAGKFHSYWNEKPPLLLMVTSFTRFS